MSVPTYGLVDPVSWLSRFHPIFSIDLVPPIRHVRNHHSLAFQTPFANTDIYKCSFFPQTIRDWNSLTDTFLSAAEGAEDSVAKFTSLVRARD